MHLRSIDIDAPGGDTRHFPFNLPVVRGFSRVSLDSPVTIFVGENGSGKSTVMEGVAAALGLPAVGGADVLHDTTLTPARLLSEQMRFSWDRKTHRGFFLRAEDFFNFTRRLSQMQQELTEMADEYDRTLTGYALGLAKGAVLGEKAAIVEKYGENPDARSHGESFLHIFRERFVPDGLYLLDEPEAPLSPQRQLALLSMIKEMVEEKSAQFIIATHSPILMGYPDAHILSFDEIPPAFVAYDEVEHVQLTRSFLNGPEAFLRHL